MQLFNTVRGTTLKEIVALVQQYLITSKFLHSLFEMVYHKISYFFNSIK